MTCLLVKKNIALIDPIYNSIKERVYWLIFSKNVVSDYLATLFLPKALARNKD